MYDSQLRLKDELKTVNTNAFTHLTPGEYIRWNNCKSSHRFQTYNGKALVLFKLHDGLPEIEDQFTCREVEVTFEKGLVTHWESQSGREFAVGTIPREVVPSVFMWMPKYATVALHSYKEGTSATVPVVWKTASNPEVKVDGNFYLLERRVFEERFLGERLTQITNTSRG